jgi:cholesterol oxidase
LIQSVTGKADIQVVAHCFGSTTFFMAMLAGLQGVRSAVVSQIATHIEAPAITRLKSGLHVPSLLDDLGIESLTAYVDTHAQWYDRLYDKALELFPMEKEEQCNSRVCHRITFMYSLLYEHSQLNQATHDALHEMFGVANVDSLKHLSLLVRKDHLVDANGNEAYMPHLDRLAIPIRFLHGAENACFKPISTERTLEALQQANEPALYDRFVIPNYGHIDCIYGKNAVHDVYPKMLEHLEKTA